MKKLILAVTFAIPLFLVSCGKKPEQTQATQNPSVENQASAKYSLGVRPYYLVNDLDEGELKTKLLSCVDKPVKARLFSIGHRGAALQFAEHTKESYLAAAKMAAGIVECDVTFTKDKELVCRHSQCDLHTSTNILATDLAKKCSVAPKFSEDGKLVNAADIKCCTSDITLAEFKSLKGKMDGANKSATSIAEYMQATPNWRTDLYTQNATLMTHKESIALFKKLGVKLTPELKKTLVPMPFDGFTKEAYAQKMIDEIVEAGVKPEDVWVQSSNINDINYWLEKTPEFGKQAVYLDELMYIHDKDEKLVASDYEQSIKDLEGLYAKGVRYISPPLFVLAEAKNGKIVASKYLTEAVKAKLKVIAWSLERAGLLANKGGWYYQTMNDIIKKDSDVLVLLDVLAKAGVVGVFSDWPATTSYYANCMDLK